ncbi:MAG TPA: DUF5989 family protein [Verrucomicrobiae bacterium]|nr:DUF5989 family protein [Verrucomicrobiae bacterium]
MRQTADRARGVPPCFTHHAPRITFHPLASPRSTSYNIPNRMWQFVKEFLQFLRQEKKWWLVPLVVLLVILVAVIVFTGGSVLAPLMYPFH